MPGRGGGGLLAVLLLSASAARAQGPPGGDTVAVHIETGASAEYSNEMFYEDAYADTTFLGRRLVETPEPRYAGMLYTLVQGTRGGRSSVYQIANELSLGDKVQREALGIDWRSQLGPDWRLAVHPAFEWRHDQSFERDQEQWNGTLGARLRRSFSDQATGLELGALADLARSRGEGSEFLPDRDALRGSLAIDHMGLLGDEWRLAYSLATRVFPDSTTRDHYEHAWDGHWRGPRRRQRAAAQSHRPQAPDARIRDRAQLWEEASARQTDFRTADRWGITTRLDGEALQYDRQEPEVYFNYRVARARAGLRYESPARWTLTAGPRAELLSAPLSPDEDYRELAGALEPVLGGHSLWDVTPAAGWRAYTWSGRDAVAAGLHSSYAFVDLDAFVDQPLMDRLRLRGLAAVRYESHTDPSQNAVSVQLSAQVRWGAR
jgi:hypothetical protein